MKTPPRSPNTRRTFTFRACALNIPSVPPVNRTLFLLPTLTLAATLAASSARAQSFAVGYNFANLPGANQGQVAAPVAATATDPSLTLGGLTRDHGFGPNTYTPNFTNYSFGVNPALGDTTAAYQATAAAAHNVAQDITFTLTPKQTISLTTLRFGVGDQNGSPGNGATPALGFSTDGGATFTYLNPATQSTTGGNTTTPDVGTFTLPSSLANITTPVVFQLYMLVPGGDGYADGAYYQPGTTTLDVEVDGTVAPATNKPVIGINLTGVADFDYTYLFADAAKETSRWGSPAVPYDGSSVVDANGDPNQDAGLTFVSTSDAPRPDGTPSYVLGGTYHVQATGRINSIVPTVYNNFTVANYAYNASTNTTTADLIVPSTSNNLFIAFTGTSRDGSTPTGSGTGFTNLHIMRPRTINGSNPYPVGTVFTDQIKAFMRQFQLIRFLDYMGINSSPEMNWSDRRLPTREFGAAVWEDAIQLCNETGCDMYVQIPELATGSLPTDTTSYIYKLAQLLKYGSDAQGNVYTSTQASPVHAPLSSSLHMYIEYSNEVWNSSLGSQFQQNLNAANTEVNAGGSPLNFDGSTNQYEWAWRRIAKRIKETSDIFRAVFGDEAMNTRVRPLLEWQNNNAQATSFTELEFLNNYYNNAAGSYVQKPRPPSYYLWGAGGDSYYRSNNDTAKDANGNNTVDAIYAAGVPESDLPGTLSGESLWARVYGLHPTSYEGGWAVSYDGFNSNTVDRQAKIDPRAKQTALTFQSEFDLAGSEVNIIYQSSGPGTWGVADPNIFDDPTPPAVQGYVAAQQANRVLPTASNPGYGTLVPGTVSCVDGRRIQNFYGGFTSNGGFAGLAPNLWLSYLFEVPASGNYRVTLNALNTTSGSGLIDVLADGQLLGTLSVPNSSTYQDVSTVAYLPAGAHNLRLLAHTSGMVLNTLGVTGGVTVVKQIACGSSAAVGSFAVDSNFSGGTKATSTTGVPIAPTTLSQYAPAQVYNTQRTGTFSYSLTGLTAGAAYQVRLHFAELVYGPTTPGSSGMGQRLENVSINGAAVLTAFDIDAQAGGGDKAVVRQFAAVADASGKITVSVAPNSASPHNVGVLNALELLK